MTTITQRTDGPRGADGPGRGRGGKGRFGPGGGGGGGTGPRPGVGADQGQGRGPGQGQGQRGGLGRGCGQTNGRGRGLGPGGGAGRGPGGPNTAPTPAVPTRPAGETRTQDAGSGSAGDPGDPGDPDSDPETDPARATPSAPGFDPPRACPPETAPSIPRAAPPADTPGAPSADTASPGPCRGKRPVCPRAGLDRAEAHCRRAGARLTPARRRVLEVLLTQGQAGPLGAYDIRDRLAEADAEAAPTTDTETTADPKATKPARSDGRPAPMAVYRALDFLVETGLAHRIESLNAYVACANPGPRHDTRVLVCEGCGGVTELTTPPLDAALTAAAAAAGFRPHRAVVEIFGLCLACQASTAANSATTDGDGSRP